MTRLAGLALLLAAGAAGAADATLVFPAGDGRAGLALDVTAGGKSSEAAWAAFLDRLFDHFDRSADDALAPAEYERVFALPLADGRAAKPDFAAFDADKDGKLTRAEFRAGWRAAGFTPVVVRVAPAPADVMRLGRAAFSHLDRDGNGVLSAAELRQTAALLHRFDEDEDEVLTAAELLATASATALPPAGVTAGTGAAPAALKLAVGEKATLSGDGPFRLSTDGARLTVPNGTCAIATTGADAVAGVRATRGFYTAQFQAAAGDGPAAKAVFADDPTAQVLAALFDPADGDGDGRLTHRELDAFFDLIEAGVGCRVVVTVTDRGRNLFDLLDRDADGRLDLAELTRAARDLPNALAGANAAGVPASYRLTVAAGTPGGTFGPVPLGAVPAARPAARPAPADAPRWFAAMDRNRDGFVSAAEFTGPPALFTKLDRDGDGRLSAEEAAAAER